jgi:hypothetical protein
MSGRIIYTEDYLSFLAAVFSEVRSRGCHLEEKRIEKEIKETNYEPGTKYSIEPIHYGNVFNECLSLEELNYKKYIDEKYKARFVTLFKAENEDAVNELIDEIATDIYNQRVKGNPIKTIFSRIKNVFHK